MAATDLKAGLERDDIQGLLASGYGHLREARFLLLAIDDPALAGAWLGRLADELTTARAKSRGAAVNVALAASGLAKLGLPPALGKLSNRFLDGMTAEPRSRALGDVDGDAPEHWRWGGPTTAPVDLLLLLYAEDESSLATLEQRLTGADAGLELVERLDTQWSDREHFGFRDGIAQPVVEGLREGPPDDTIKAGEFVLGYPNEYGEVTGRPLVSRSADPDGILSTDDVSGDADLGRNGCYLVLRQLSQDVAGFWSFLDRVTSDADGRSDPDARVLSRTPSTSSATTTSTPTGCAALSARTSGVPTRATCWIRTRGPSARSLSTSFTGCCAGVADTAHRSRRTRRRAGAPRTSAGCTSSASARTSRVSSSSSSTRGSTIPSSMGSTTTPTRSWAQPGAHLPCRRSRSASA